MDTFQEGTYPMGSVICQLGDDQPSAAFLNIKQERGFRFEFGLKTN